jgi:dolichol-phosphate mannosyltransferase
MISPETWPQPAARLWVLAQRFQKFIVVGSIGLVVNQGLLFLLRDFGDVRLVFASPMAIFASMIVTFTLNEMWTWHDRGSGPIKSRIALYFPINLVGLLINFVVLTMLVDHAGWHYLLANLVGAGCAAIWNFVLNNMVTWRE